MYPIDDNAPRPEIPYSERIFATSKELHEAYANKEPWTETTPLHEASVLLVLTAVEDATWALVDRWNDCGMMTPFPDALAVRDEIIRIVCKEAKEEYAAELANKI